MLMVLSCKNPKKTNTNDSNNTENIDTLNKLSGYVSSGENYILKQVPKKPLILIGKNYETEHKNISTLIIGTLNVLNEFLLVNKIKIDGSIMCVYNNIPTENEKIKIFVGIPIQKETKVKSDFEFLKIPGGNYHKATVNLGLGKTTKMWNVITQNLRNNGFEIPLPIYEYPSDARNFDMTTEITHSNLLIPVKPKK
jgi:predicted transcriptional regulator YdeE